MKDALTKILETVIQDSVFLAQISADVCALKAVVFALGPEAKKVFDEELAVQSYKFRQVAAGQKILLEALKQRISGISN